MEQLKDVILKQALLDLRAKALQEQEACGIDPKRVPLVNPQVIVDTIDEIFRETKLCVARLEFIKDAITYQSGGNCGIDFLTMNDGTVLSITDESVVHWRSMEDFEADAGDIECYSQLYLTDPTKATGLHNE